MNVASVAPGTHIPSKPFFCFRHGSTHRRSRVSSQSEASPRTVSNSHHSNLSSASVIFSARNAVKCLSCSDAPVRLIQLCNASRRRDLFGVQFAFNPCAARLPIAIHSLLRWRPMEWAIWRWWGYRFCFSFARLVATNHSVSGIPDTVATSLWIALSADSLLVAAAAVSTPACWAVPRQDSRSCSSTRVARPTSRRWHLVQD